MRMASATTTSTTAEAALLRARLVRIELKTVLITVLLGCLFVLVLYPPFMLVLNSFRVGGPGTEAPAFGLGNWVEAFRQPGLIEATRNTIVLTVLLQLIAFPIAVGVSWLLARTDIPGKNWIDLAFWITFFMPILPVTLGWILLFDPNFGLANQVAMKFFGLKAAPFNIYSFAGIVWVHLVTRTIATKIILLTPAFRNMDSSLEEASRISGRGSFGTLRRVVVPIMLPSIIIVFLMGTIHTLESFEIERVLGPAFQFYVYSTKIYQMIRAEPVDYGSATVLGVLVLIAMIPLILVQQRISSKSAFATISGKSKTKPYALGRWKWPAFVLVLGMGVVFTLIPLVFLLMGTFMRLFGFFGIDKAFTLDHWVNVLTNEVFLRSLGNSLIVGAGTAIAAVLLFSILAYVVVKTKYAGRGLIDFLSWLPIAIPGIIMGLGFLWLFLRTPVLQPLYGGVFSLILVTFLASMTLGVQLFKSNLLLISNDLEESSWVSGGSWRFTFRRVIVPLLAPTLISVGIVSFVVSIRNVSNIALLTTSQNQTLAIMQMNYMADGSYEGASVLGVIVVVLTTGVAILARILGLKVGRINS
jgi:iron(III) transport system permease protein